MSVAIAGGGVDAVDVAVGQLGNAAGDSCTATLIAPDVAITAGHCVGSPPLTFTFADGGFTGQTVTTHPLFERDTLANDVAIVALDHASTTPPIALSAATLATGDPIVLVGFGRDAGGASGVRRSANLSVGELLGPAFLIDGAMNACAGDSGGPSLASGAIAGLTSAGTATCGSVSEHMRMRAYLPWLAAHVPGATIAGGPLAPDTAPTIAVRRPGDGATMPDELTVGVQIGDDYGALAVAVAVDGVPNEAFAVTGDQLSLPLAIAPGDHVLTLTATDASGLTSSTDLALTIEPPIHDPRTPGAACWDDTDCDSTTCEDHVCGGPEHGGGGGCSTGDSPEGAWLLVLAAVAASGRRRAKTRACPRAS